MRHGNVSAPFGLRLSKHERFGTAPFDKLQGERTSDTGLPDQ
jgi:hypothetical protein